MGIHDVVAAPASPWQNPHVERVIGSIRREFLDHVVVVNWRHLKRLLANYFGDYHDWCVHRSLDMDAPNCRAELSTKPNNVVEFPAVQGLHHYYLPRVA
ncbi:MAG: integrase core domain-containing protein [Gammaproteobacteria bacterium]